MATAGELNGGGPPRSALASGLQVALAFTAAMGVFGALLFWSAGRLGWPAGWAYLAIVAVTFAVNLLCLRRWNPELIERRLHPGDGTKTWDKVWGALYGPLHFALYVVAGLEVRWETATLPLWLWPVGLALYVPGNALLTWSMVVNPFFEKTVRIQTERGHRVIDTGPYAWVRHPGYAGFLGWILSAPLLLGSWWALVPAGLCVVGVVIRTALEDRTLRRELDGYEAYTRRTRHRLVPGIW